MSRREVGEPGAGARQSRLVERTKEGPVRVDMTLQRAGEGADDVVHDTDLGATWPEFVGRVDAVDDRSQRFDLGL